MSDPADSGKSGSRFENFGRQVDQSLGTAIPRMEEEVKKVIAYLNDEVVPQIRQNSSEALRSAAEQLNKLAEHLDRNRRGAR
jgi:microcompartment protein CcmL/EutN